MERHVLGPYDGYELSTLVSVDDLVFVGHVGGYADEDGRLLDTIEEQMAQTLTNLEGYLSEVGVGLRDVVKLTVILRDIDAFHGMHSVWTEYFQEGEYPVRTVITSDFVDEKILVQVEGVALVGS